jgi:hypothetical protein
MANKDLRNYLEEPLDETALQEATMTLKQIAAKESISHVTVANILKKAMETFYKRIAADEDFKGMDAFERVVLLSKMIESLGGTVEMEGILKMLPKDIVKQVKMDAKDHME